MKKRCIIIGASHAGVACAQKLRRQGWEGLITVVGEEAHTPYHRPPLSKDYLKGAKEKEGILLASKASYEKFNIETMLGVQVVAIDRIDKQVEIAGGTLIDYDKLVFATGARTRELPFAPRERSGVYYLRDMQDVDQIRAQALEKRHAVIVGGGYIGLEAAATLRALGLNVTIVEAMDRVLQRVTSEPVSKFFKRLHQEAGVEVREQCQVAGLVGTDQVEAVELSTGEQIKADLVIIGIGVIPNTQLAQSADLTVENGIVVSSLMQTDDPDVFAIGDVANAFHARYKRQLRIESVQNANDQAMTAAKAIVGKPEPYDALPWFWSDQYDVKLQIAGLAQGFDQFVIRSTPVQERSMSVVYLKDSTVLSVDAMNSPRDFVHGKKLIQSASPIDIERLKDPELSLLDAVTAG